MAATELNRAADKSRLFIKLTRDSLPQVRERFPFLYLEHGRLEVDDASVKWIDSRGQVIALPIATILCLLLGPGISVTHEAIKVTASANCNLAWVGEDGLIFYAAGHIPTSDTRNLRTQLRISADPKMSLEVARWMFSLRFPNADLVGKTLKQMMGIEGNRVRERYRTLAEHYDVQWDGRRFTPGNFGGSSTTNQILTACNAALYGIISAVVHALGFSPHAGFIHSGSPLPFIYDLADLYKEKMSVDLAFSLTKQLAGFYDRKVIANEFRKRAVETNLVESICQHTFKILEFEPSSL